jgi:DNA-binding transcriptional ArsR family regulator
LKSASKNQKTKTLDPLVEQTLLAGLRGMALFELFDSITYGPSLRYTAELFGALGHPTRIKIIQTLRKGALTVNQLASLVGCSQANMSQHLSVLLKTGLLQKEAEGSSRLYSLRGQEIAQVIDIIQDFYQTHQEDLISEAIR